MGLVAARLEYVVYTVLIERSAEKVLSKLNEGIAERISVAIKSLALNPRPVGAKKLTNTEQWRIRIGNYRVVYQINDKVLIVRVIRLGHRRDIYMR
jgi:mRNA interferase RelE/StbE